jgi:selenocysteine-specific elongation factor
VAEPREETAPAARHFILGTAGHVDHGKTELVRALTGHDTDRLKEEKERGISIELGFAPLALAGDVFLGIVDVPGHERFVRQMVAGAGGIDMAMLLIAADEGVMPQTREHVEVLRSLGIRHAVVVISKSDLATDEMLTLVREEIAALAHGTFLESAPVVAVSARSGAGLDILRETLLRLAHALEVRASDGPFRLAVDRVFHQKGIGVVVTGSCYSGRVRAGDELDLLPAQQRVRVREVQSFGARRAEGLAGERLALALQGVRLEEIQRGDMLATPGRFAVTQILDVRVTLAAEDAAALANRERIRIHHGAREVLGRVILFERDELGAGESGLAQLRLEQPIVADADDRVVIRSYSPAHVKGGAVVIDPRAQAHRRSDADAIGRLRHREEGDPADVLARALERAGAAGLAESDADAALSAALVSRGEARVLAGRVYHRDVLARLADAIVEMVKAHIHRHPLQWGIDKEELRRRIEFPHGVGAFNRVIEALAGTHPIFVRGSRVRVGSPDMALSPELERAVGRLRDSIVEHGVAFASRDELGAGWSARESFADAVTVLKGRGEAVEIDDGLIHPAALDRGVEVLRAWFAGRTELAVGDLKDALGVTRKHAIPLLEFFDRHGFTVRRGNARVAGPALSGARKSVETEKLGLPENEKS